MLTYLDVSSWRPTRSTRRAEVTVGLQDRLRPNKMVMMTREMREEQ